MIGKCAFEYHAVNKCQKESIQRVYETAKSVRLCQLKVNHRITTAIVSRRRVATKLLRPSTMNMITYLDKSRANSNGQLQLLQMVGVSPMLVWNKHAVQKHFG